MVHSLLRSCLANKELPRSSITTVRFQLILHIVRVLHRKTCVPHREKMVRAIESLCNRKTFIMNKIEGLQCALSYGVHVMTVTCPAKNREETPFPVYAASCPLSLLSSTKRKHSSSQICRQSISYQLALGYLPTHDCRLPMSIDF